MAERNILVEQILAKSNAKHWQDKEAVLRREIVATYGTPGMTTGTERPVMPDGTELRIKHVLNYNVTNKNGQVDHLRSIMPSEVFADLFRHKWELSVSAYAALTPAQQKVIDCALTITPGMPELEVIKAAQEKVI